MRSILFGGSFDPPHAGHLQIAEHVIANNIADELVFVPCQDHPFDKRMSSSADRVAMLGLLTPPHTSISLYEIEKPGKSYSIETLKYFSKNNPGTI
jgi:nicotinate-nucleotide adenylyltransferase